MSHDASRGSAGRRGRAALAVVGLLAALFFVLVYRQVLGITQRPSWPPPAGAVTAASAQAATEAFDAEGGKRPHDAALDLAWSTAATIDPWVEGANFFPRIFADVEAARSSVHILMFGWREGEVGTRLAELLEKKLDQGVEVRVIVDRFGSRPYQEAQEMFTRLADAGAQIVVNDVFPIDRDGLFPDDRSFDWRQDEVGRADHRKLYVIDGAVAWTGGAGIEDHFENGGFHDVMVRVTGDVVRQAQAAFLTSFRGHGGPLPDDLSRHFPEPTDAGDDADRRRSGDPRRLRRGLAGAPRADRRRAPPPRRDEPVRDRPRHDRAGPRRGAPRSASPTGRLRDVEQQAGIGGAAGIGIADLIAAGVEIWELPGTVVHAKVVIADDVVSFGTVNLDSWALYRNSEIMMLARSAEAAALFEERLFEPDIARSTRGEPPSGTRERLESWLWDKLTSFL